MLAAALVQSLPVAAFAQGFGPSPTPDPGPPPPSGPLTPPRLLHFVEAEYPTEARAAGTQATVLLQLDVIETGRVSTAVVIESAGEAFDTAAINAARQFEFTPAQQGGRPVGVHIRYRYRFTLRAPPPPPVPQTARIRGVVRDATDAPVAGATVTVRRPDGTEDTRISDPAGAFQFELAPTPVTVTVTATGFDPMTAQESLGTGESLAVTYRLVPVAVAPPPRGRRRPTVAVVQQEQGVTVRTARPQREVTRTTLEREEIMRIPGSGGDALRSIQSLPGVARAPFLSGALIIRGAAPADTQVFADGSGIPLLYHFGGLTSTIPTEMLDRIDFYPGNFSSRFGRAMGGIVDVGLRSPTRTGHRVVANISVIDVSLFGEMAITPTLSVALSVRRSWIDAVLAAVLPSLGTGIVAAPVYWDYQGVIEWRPTVRDRVRLAVFGSDDTISIIFGGMQDPTMVSLSGGLSFSTRYHIAQLSYARDLGPRTTLRAMLSGGWTNTGFAFGTLFNLNNNVYPINFRYEASHAPNTAVRVNAGFDVIAAPNNSVTTLRGNIPGTNVMLDLDSRTTGYTWHPALYAEAEITPTPATRIVPGLRFDFFRDIGAATVSPRLSARHRLTRDLSIKGGVGVFTQPPQFNESSPAPNAFSPGLATGNPNLRPQQALHVSLGAEYSFTSYLSCNVEGFYKILDSLILANNGAFGLGGAAPAMNDGDPAGVAGRQVEADSVPYTNNQIGRVYGLEVLLRYRATPGHNFFGWVAYTLMRSERRDLPDADYHLFAQDQTHILTIVASYKLPYGFQVGGRFRYVTGIPTTPTIGAFYDASTASFTPIMGAMNSVRIRDFHQLDLRVDKTWRRSWGQVGLFLEVLNVYNQVNQEGISYNYDYSQSQTVSGLPFLPNLGLRGEF